MEHLQIAYDLFVIMIGLAALLIVVFWAVRRGKATCGIARSFVFIRNEVPKPMCAS